MLDGITILSTGVIKVATAGVGPGVLLMFILSATIFILPIFINISITERDNTSFIVWALLLFTIPMMMMFYSLEGPKIEYPKWKVTIDDSVSFVEFMERYEILSQEGKIYEITEKKGR